VRVERMTELIVVLIFGGLSLALVAQDQKASGADVLKHLTGTWRAAEDRTPRTTPLDEQVFGRGAVDVRIVSLVVAATGDATLQIRKSVVAAKGKVFAPSIIEVKMKIGEPVVSELGHLRPTVTVSSAEERYLDGDRETFPRPGMRVTLSLLNATSDELNMQFEPAEGQDGFGATLTLASSGRKAR
jgi:hypothetical protein